MPAKELKAMYRELSDGVDRLVFERPTEYVYNPLEYARDPAEQYLAKAGASGKEAIFLGMNPGPWGMAQTGIPFGEIAAVKNFPPTADRTAGGIVVVFSI